MSYTDYKKILNVIKNKPGKIKKFYKHNVPKSELAKDKPKARTCGIGRKKCQICLRVGGHVNQYGLCLCRQCFRENALKLGFKKFD